MITRVLSASCRLWVILARDAPRAAIFRRGPSSHVLLALWHTDSDRVEEGQWLKGRIDERGADLSPDGALLAYPAAQHRRRALRTWIAVSRPPWLTALVVFPSPTGPGALWQDDRTLALTPGFDRPHADTPLPRGLRVVPLALGAGLARPGWDSLGPRHHVRPRPRDASLELHARRVRAERGLASEHRLVSTQSGAPVIDLAGCEWADWDRNGDLLFARAGVLFRTRWRPRGFAEPRVVVDLRERRFEAREAPATARRWKEAR